MSRAARAGLETMAADIASALGGSGQADFKQFLSRQRWFAAKTRGIDRLAIRDWAVLDPAGPCLLLLADADADTYFVPVTVSDLARGGEAIALLGRMAVVDAHRDPAFGRRIVDAMAAGGEIAGRAGRFSFKGLSPWQGPAASETAAIEVRVLSGEQSNTSVTVGRGLVLKSIRRPSPGVNPEIEITGFLTSRGADAHTPRLVGWMEYAAPGSEPATISVLQGYIDNRGDGWSHVLRVLERSVDALPRTGPRAAWGAVGEADGLLADLVELGRVTGGLHRALASDARSAAFAPEPVTPGDADRWARDICRALGDLATTACAAASRRVAQVISPGVEGTAAGAPERVRRGLDLLVRAGTHKIRCHGDYHLGQVLKTADSFAVIDFEGEPARPLAERRARQAPLRDVAGMLRSLDYAVHAVLRARPPGAREAAAPWLARWHESARAAFLDGYAAAVAASPVPLAPVSREYLAAACLPFEIDKACYEVRYELDNRPDWVDIPLAGLARLLGAASAV